MEPPDDVADDQKAAGIEADGDEAVVDEPAAAAPHRFVLFTPGGPLVVTVRLTIDGEPHEVLFGRLIDQVLEAADTDGDGRPTWDEVSRSPTFIYGLLGNQPLRGGQARAAVKQQYDIDRDGVVDRGEVPRFVTANRGKEHGIALSSSSYNPDRARLDSPLRRLLDADRNGLLSGDEIASAWERLISRDVDDDRVVHLGNITPTAARVPGAMPMPPQSNRGGGPDAAMWLASMTSWDTVLYTLNELYTTGGVLGDESFPLFPQLFAQLDGDGNGRLTKEELAVLRDIPPHIELSARFGRESNEAATPTLRLDSLAAELSDGGAVVLEHKQSVSIVLAGVEVSFFIRDEAFGSDYEAAARRRLEALDTDKNGYLDAEEFSIAMMQFMAPLEAVDQNEDQKIDLAEITDFMEQKEAAARSQIVINAGDAQDALFSALDGNNDARLDERELAEVEQRLGALDVGADGNVSVDEIPVKLSIGIVRGLPPMGAAPYTTPPAAPKEPEPNIPRWFTRMDANGDGSISRREFLGTSEQFEELDLDGDQFVDSDELPQPDTSGKSATSGT